MQQIDDYLRLRIKINIMRFIKVITEHTQESLDKFVLGLDVFTLERFNNVYNSFNYVEFENKNKTTAMYAAITHFQIETLFLEYVKHEINFSYEDITRNVLFGDLPTLEDEEKNKNLQAMTRLFIEDFLDIDTVLEKIKERGMESINETDIRVLESH
jgi:hypothetical protein